MTAIVLATGISHLLSHDTIYTLKLRRRGVDLDAPPHATAMTTVTVAQVMEPVDGPPARKQRHCSTPPDLLSRSPHAQLRSLDAAGRYRGVVTARAVTDALADGEHDDTPVATVVSIPAAVTLTDRLDQTLDALDTARGPIAVLDADHRNVVGWLTHQQVLLALHPPRSISLQPSDSGAATTADPVRKA